MRLKSSIWVAAYLRRCQSQGAFAVLRRRGAEEAGSIFVKVSRLDGSADLYGPAPQAMIDPDDVQDRSFSLAMKDRPASDAAVEEKLAREVRFDPDCWIVEVEDRQGRSFIDTLVD